MGISRRNLLKSTFSTAVTCAFVKRAQAQAAEFTYKFANNVPLSHPLNVRAQEAAERIKTETGGKFELKIFANNQLGSDILGQLRSGAIEFYGISPLILSTFIPNASISGTGFAFPDYDAVWKAMDGDLGAYVRGAIGNAGLVVLDQILDNRFRHPTLS